MHAVSSCLNPVRRAFNQGSFAEPDDTFWLQTAQGMASEKSFPISLHTGCVQYTDLVHCSIMNLFRGICKLFRLVNSVKFNDIQIYQSIFESL
jgi:hypothetical protein